MLFSLYATLPVAAADLVLSETPVAEGFSHPLQLISIPDGSLLVAQQDGTIFHIFMNGQPSAQIDATPDDFLYTPEKGLGGLIDVELDPDFTTNGQIYLSYLSGPPAMTSIGVMRATFAGNRLADRVILFHSITKMVVGCVSGGKMAFAADKSLIVDVEGGCRRSDIVSWQDDFGKFIRIDRNGAFPGDNPFLNAGPNFQPEIYAPSIFPVRGGIALDASTGNLWINAHGIGLHELLPYSYKGHTITDPYPIPSLAWAPATGGGGMVFYTGAQIPQLQRELLVAEPNAMAIRAVHFTNGIPDRFSDIQLAGQKALCDIKMAADGGLYGLTCDTFPALISLTAAQ